MNQINQYIFNLYHYILNLRDTMEYGIERDHSLQIYEQRKSVLTKGLEPGSAFGNFIENNGEQGQKLKEKIQDFINEFYSEDSTILKVANESVRVDHTQHVALYEATINMTETLRDILYQYVALARKQNEADPRIEALMDRDEHMYRYIIAMLVTKEFSKSFAEFQKVMSESKGQPTPQSNFIVQNEIVKLTNLIRFSRQHCKCIDNATLDTLDEINELIEMTEGRRERRDGKPFGEFFNDIAKRVNEAIGKAEPIWKDAYQPLMQEMIETVKKAQEEKASA